MCRMHWPSLCRSNDCLFLCHCMYTFTCYDFLNAHVCKHIHRVHSLPLPVTNHAIQQESTVIEEDSGEHNQTTPELPETTTRQESSIDHNQTTALQLREGTCTPIKESSQDEDQTAPDLNELADINLQHDVPAPTIETETEMEHFSTGLVYTYESRIYYYIYAQIKHYNDIPITDNKIQLATAKALVLDLEQHVLHQASLITPFLSQINSLLHNAVYIQACRAAKSSVEFPSFINKQHIPPQKKT